MLKVPYCDIKGMQDALDMFKFCYDNKLSFDLSRKARTYRKTLREARNILEFAMGAKVHVTAHDMYEFSKFAVDTSGIVNMDDVFSAVVTEDNKWYGVRFKIKDINRVVTFITERKGDNDTMLMHIKTSDKEYEREISHFHTATSAQFQFIYDTMLRIVLDYIGGKAEVEFDFNYSNEKYHEERSWKEIEEEIDALIKKNWFKMVVAPIFSIRKSSL